MCSETMNNSSKLLQQYDIVAKAIRYITTNTLQQPSLAEIANAVDLSEHHLQRTFKQWAGISPKRFLQFLTKEHAKQALLASKDVLSASLESGLSSPGRLHDLMITCEAMTPGEIKQHGQGVTLTYGMAETPFGLALVAWTNRGICYLAFCDDNGEQAKQHLQVQWSNAHFESDNLHAERFCQQIFTTQNNDTKLHLLLHGSNFQIKVWEALLQVGSSQIASYSTLAQLAGSPKAQRAVGTAMAANQIAYLIPCHRVIRESGNIGLYRWASERKAAIQIWETGNR